MSHPLRPHRVPCTYEDYAAIPADGKRWEVIDGEFEVNPAPTSRHQTVSRRLQFELMKSLEEPGLALVFDAPVDVILGPSDIVQPDLAIISTARAEIVSERGIEGPPDVVVEILSPGTRTLDRRVKWRTYARFQVPEYWMVDPTIGNVELWRLGGEGYTLEHIFDRAATLTTPSFVELSVSLARVFRP